MLTLIDSHCHLNFDFSPKTVDDLVKEATEAGVEKLITIGTEVKTMPEVTAVAERFENVFFTTGVHPHDAKDITEGDIEKLRNWSRHRKCVAIGEIGLDYHYDNSPRETQKIQLEAQLNLAAEEKKPVVIHSRDAESDLLTLLKNFAKISNSPSGPGVIHCFTGTQSFGQACIDLGFYISFSGIVTFKKADDLRDAVKAYPIDRILVETDSPFLAPVPFRGKKCEPKMVFETAKKVAELKGVELDELARITKENTNRLFFNS